MSDKCVDWSRYFEVMADNVWLPEDLLAIMMPYDNYYIHAYDSKGGGPTICFEASEDCFWYGSPRGQMLVSSRAYTVAQDARDVQQ